MWAGYTAVDFSKDDLRQVSYSSYDRPRSFGATGQMRLVGGVYITQHRSEYASGCPGRRGDRSLPSTRFSDFVISSECERTPVGNAFGMDAMFAKTDISRDADDGKFPSGIYNPLLKRNISNYYMDSEIKSNGVPFGFFSREHEFGNDARLGGNRKMASAIAEAAFDVYVDGSLRRDRAELLLGYLNFARFVDSHTKSVSMRIPMHNVELEMLVDVHVKFSIDFEGTVSSKFEVNVSPLFYYFNHGWSTALFALEILIAVIALSMTITTIKTLYALLNTIVENAILRLQLKPVTKISFQAGHVMREVCVSIVPIFLLVSTIIRFVYSFHYVREFSYARSYRVYDGDGSSTARLLLPLRKGEAQGPVEGYPIGALRHILPYDGTGRDAFMKLLAKIDEMHNLHSVYVMMQVPLILLIMWNAYRLLGHFPGFRPINISIHKSIPDMTTLSAVLILYTLLCGLVLHLVVGDRVKLHSRLTDGIDGLGDYILGDLSALAKDTLFDDGVVKLVAEEVVLAFVFIFYPVVTIFTIFQFTVAIVTDNFCDERERMTKIAEVSKVYKGPLAETVSEAMHTTQSHLSACLKSMGMPHLSALLLTGDARWLNQTPYHREDSEDNASDEFESTDEQTTRSVITRSKSSGSSRMYAEALKRLDDSLHTFEEGDVNKSFLEATSLAINRSVHPMTARWIRAHTVGRVEIDVPVLGSIGVTMTTNLLHAMHESTWESAAHNVRPEESSKAFYKTMSRKFSKGTKWLVDSIKSGSKSVASFTTNAVNSLSKTRSLGSSTNSKPLESKESKGDQEKGLALLRKSVAKVQMASTLVATRDHVAGNDMELFKNLERKDYERVKGRTRLLLDTKRALELKACQRLADRLVRELGHKAGSELADVEGLPLANLVLRRAQLTVRGISASARGMEENAVLYTKYIRIMRESGNSIHPVGDVRARNLPSTRYNRYISELLGTPLSVAQAAGWSVSKGLLANVLQLRKWSVERLAIHSGHDSEFVFGDYRTPQEKEMDEENRTYASWPTEASTDHSGISSIPPEMKYPIANSAHNLLYDSRKSEDSPTKFESP